MVKRASSSGSSTKSSRGFSSTLDSTQLLELTPGLASLGTLPADTFFGSPLTNNREARYENPEILYKIKTGNYLPDELARANFSSLLTTLNFKSISGLRAS